MKLSSQENRMWEMATMSFFPKDVRWSSSCFNRSNALEIKYLLCHLRDKSLACFNVKKRRRNIFIVELWYRNQSKDWFFSFVR